MSRPTFRFTVNLGQNHQTTQANNSEQVKVDSARQWEADIEKKLQAIPPAQVIAEEWQEDPLTVAELLAAYNASLQRCQNLELGQRVEAGIEYSVFIDEWENKHVVTQPLSAKGSRLSELVVSRDGIILRLSLERVSGAVLYLDHYMGVGLTDFDDETELKRIPGYNLQITRYQRQGDLLIQVEQVRKRYDLATEQVINEMELTLN